MHIRIQITKMETYTMMPSAFTLPVSSRSKCIKKVKPSLWKGPCSIPPKSDSKENSGAVICPQVKRKTVLLNELLANSNGSYKNGNMLVIRVSTINEGQVLPFKNVVKTLL